MTHPFTRERCDNGPYSHDLHWVSRPGSGWWNTATGQSTSPAGMVYANYFAQFFPELGKPGQPLEHFTEPMALRNELAGRITYGYGTSYAPGADRPTVRYGRVDPGAYMDVWVLATVDPNPPYNPPPNPDTHRPHERWSVVGDMRSQRSQYLPFGVKR
ncbi:hypothetical protein JK364_24260 [Streptomyces sp. 110]|uniref:Uncharacterized protein n=1 Tax=Streptomyces endocoffeicus TaxID=2898945 RepID=A0ABS1PST0_9ACTN|nr:hypothetical protein [Streptomyces endocoffeicus]MBL1115488.1 hypothetical protein [Streptomyces endocoffeicus]